MKTGKLKGLILSLGLALAAFNLTGCALFWLGAGAAVGAGTVAYVGGELKGAEEVKLERAWKASMRAMEQLEFKVTKTEKDALSGQITARRADDKRVIVVMKKQTDDVTEIRIRVGVFGDETVSRLIYDKIKNNF